MARATATSVSRTDSSTQLLPERGRRGFSVYNSSDAVLYLNIGAAASSSAFTVAIPANGLYEDPWSLDEAVYGCWASAGAGTAKVLEVHGGRP